MERKIVMIIDFNNLIYKCLNHRKWTATNGVEVGAVVNMINRIKQYKMQIDPDYLVFASDLSRTNTFRRKLYPMYKAQRAPTKTEMHEQMTLASRIIALLGFPIINDMNYEGDDIIGMVSRFAEDNNMNCVIVSGDHDMYQLISEYTWILDPNDSQIIDIDEMYRRTGLYPSQWVDYKMLLGDNSDNVPGIANIGKKAAPNLMREYGSLEAIYNNIDNLMPAHQAGLLDAKPRLELLRTLMTIVTDYTKINLNMDKLRRMDPFPNELYHEMAIIGNTPTSNNVRFYLLRRGRDRSDMVERNEVVVQQAVNSLDKEYDYQLKGDNNNDSAA